MRDLVEAAQSYKSVEKFENKKKIMEYIVQNIDQYTSNPRRATRKDSLFLKIKFFGESLFCGSGIYLGNYLVTTYFFIKLAYLVNSIGQFYLMNEFLGKLQNFIQLINRSIYWPYYLISISILKIPKHDFWSNLNYCIFITYLLYKLLIRLKNFRIKF